MALRTGNQFGGGSGNFGTAPDNGIQGESFNMTPIIDIVFLLIIFFLVVCQFIEAENFPVIVPDGCEFAQNNTEHQQQVTTVTVVKTSEAESEFAVGSQKVVAAEFDELVGKLAELINERLKELPAEHRVVTLRIDEDVCFGQAQYALAAVAASSATDIKMAVLKKERPEAVKELP